LEVMDSSASDSNSNLTRGELRQRMKRPKLDGSNIDIVLTPTERAHILEKAKRRLNELSSPTPEIDKHKANGKSGGTGGVPSSFIITALEELRRFEENEENERNISYMEREIEHLHRGIASRDDAISQLRAELDEKNRILESLPRELVLNWVATQRLIDRNRL